MNRLVVDVCKDRHEMPCKEYIFEKEVNPLDVEGLEIVAVKRMIEIAHKNGFQLTTYTESPEYGVEYMTTKFNVELVIYVTGLTVAVISVLKVALNLFRNVRLMHYDRDSGTYYPQIW